MTIKFKCPDCETIMDLDESEEMHKCPSCEYETTFDTAEKLFEEGEIIACVSDDDILQEDEIEDISETETWKTNLILQNEYVLVKNLIKKSKDEDTISEESIKELIESKSKLFEDVDLDQVDWSEISENLNDEFQDYKQISQDLIEAFKITEEITPETKEEIVTIFESAVTVKINDIKLQMMVEFEEKLEKSEKEIQEDTISEIDEYLDTVVSEWMIENELALEQGIKTEITENFLDGLQKLFKEHYIDVPEDRYDILEDLANKVDELESTLNEEKVSKRNVENDIIEMKKSYIIAELSSTLVETDKERLNELADSIDYESDEEFKTSLITLRESFIDSKNNKNPDDKKINEDFIIDEDDKEEKKSDYLNDNLMKRTLEILASPR